MIAIEINGEIKTFDTIPTEWKRTIGYNYSDAETIYKDGFRQVVEPFLDVNKQKGNIYFDVVNDCFTYEILEKEIVVATIIEPTEIEILRWKVEDLESTIQTLLNK